MRHSAKPVVGMLVTVIVLALSATASAATFSGVVVHHNTRARSFVVALGNGTLRSVHAGHAPRLGRRVVVTARLLHNGTWALQRMRVGKATRRVHIRGTVTYVNLRRHVFVVSARGVSLLVHAHRTGAGDVRAASSPVADGQQVAVDGVLDDDSVEANNVQTTGEDVGGVDLEGTVQSIDATARSLSISADDSEQSGATLTVDVPASFDLSQFSPGQSVELLVAPNGDGTYTLQQSSNDTGAQNADNQGEDQGLNPSGTGGGDN